MRPREVLFLAMAIAAYFALEAHDSPPEQSWRLSRSRAPGSVRFAIKSVKPGRRVQWDSDVPLRALRGLSGDSLSRSSNHVQFALVRDAGALLCEGDVRFGSGAGVFRFQPDPDFNDQLRRLGYPEPDLDASWDLAVHNVTIDFARAVRDAGMRTDTRDLVRLRQHGID